MVESSQPKRLKPKGLYCPNPACLGTSLRVTSVRRPCPGKKIRYLVCTACGARRKTTEK